MTLTLGKEKKKTTAKKKTLEPVWEEAFAIPHSDPGALLMVQVDDYDMGSGNDFMGQVKIPVKALEDGAENREWRRLCTLENEVDNRLGQVLLAMRWMHNPELVASAAPVAADPALEATFQDLDEGDVELKNSHKPELEAEDEKVDGKEPNELRTFKSAASVRASGKKRAERSASSSVPPPPLFSPLPPRQLKRALFLRSRAEAARAAAPPPPSSPPLSPSLPQHS